MQVKSSAFNKAQKNIDQFLNSFQNLLQSTVFSRILHNIFLYTKQWNSSLFDASVHHKIQDPKNKFRNYIPIVFFVIISFILHHPKKLYILLI